MRFNRIGFEFGQVTWVCKVLWILREVENKHIVLGNDFWRDSFEGHCIHDINLRWSDGTFLNVKADVGTSYVNPFGHKVNEGDGAGFLLQKAVETDDSGAATHVQ